MTKLIWEENILQEITQELDLQLQIAPKEKLEKEMITNHQSNWFSFNNNLHYLFFFFFLLILITSFQIFQNSLLLRRRWRKRRK
jgi:hypothetical protein